MTFKQLLTNVYADLSYSNPPTDTAVITRLKSWMNEGHRKVLRIPGMVGLRQRVLPLTSAAGVPVYGFPQAFERIDAVVETTNQRRLQYRTRDWYRTLDPGERSSGNPFVWVDEGLWPVLRQPVNTGSGLWAVSDSASDTTQTVDLIGVRLNGDEEPQATAALNGLTRVAVGALTDYISIVRWSLTGVAVGNVLLYDAASSGNLLGRIPIGQTNVNYMAVRLWPTPSAALTYNVDGQLAIPDLVNDDDVPMIPDTYCDLLACYTRWREFKKTGDFDRATLELAEFDTQVGQLQAYVSFPNDYRPIAGQYPEDLWRWSNLGGQFPADGWGRG